MKQCVRFLYPLLSHIKKYRVISIVFHLAESSDRCGTTLHKTNKHKLTEQKQRRPGTLQINSLGALHFSLLFIYVVVRVYLCSCKYAYLGCFQYFAIANSTTTLANKGVLEYFHILGHISN